MVVSLWHFMIIPERSKVQDNDRAAALRPGIRGDHKTTNEALTSLKADGIQQQAYKYNEYL